MRNITKTVIAIAVLAATVGCASLPKSNEVAGSYTTIDRREAAATQSNELYGTLLRTETTPDSYALIVRGDDGQEHKLERRSEDLKKLVKEARAEGWQGTLEDALRASTSSLEPGDRVNVEYSYDSKQGYSRIDDVVELNSRPRDKVKIKLTLDGVSSGHYQK